MYKPYDCINWPYIMNFLSEILSSKIRAEIFRLLFGLNDCSLHMREIERRTGFAIGTIQAELKKLIRVELLIKRKDGNRLYYCANKDHPVYPDIRNIILKTVGLADIFQNVLTNEKDIVCAFIFGSAARNEMQAESDIDLMVIGNIGLRKVTGILSGLSQQVGREITPHVLKPEEFKKRTKESNHFLTQVLSGPKLFIKGNVDELDALEG